jgi:hypothetical protein
MKASSITNEAIAFSIFSATPEITMPPKSAVEERGDYPIRVPEGSS